TIALSVVFVAREALVSAPGRGAVPLVAALGFGLLHGFGFAGALASLGLPRGHALPALFAFNVGVELGQLLVVGGVIAALWVTGLLRQASLRRPAAFVLGVGAALLTLERVWEVLRWT
ncbi:MAG: HupE/UreJ family protein, partial [Myxococcales bacterium]|nr:HupE/UreJ family protein [Myxococcales bacterium]